MFLLLIHVCGRHLQISLKVIHFFVLTSNLKVAFEIVGVGHVSMGTHLSLFFGPGTWH